MIKKTIHLIRILTHMFIFITLTFLTQVGGVVYLLSRLTHQRINRKVARPVLRPFAKLGTFVLIYILSAFIIIPILARPFGRVALPVTTDHHLQPLRWTTCLMNRHYVRPALKAAVIDVTQKMNRLYPGTHVNYLDAGFPFFNNFPLLPHLSHNDGKKLDLSFLYIDRESGLPSNDAPSVIGYGICEEPRPGEINTAASCEAQDYRWYSVLKRVIQQDNKEKYTFDSLRTRALVNIIAFNPAVHKIFIEPHLQTRLKLDNEKIRFQGCQAVRHDDHIHLQL
jgi:hypothetical protein